MVMVGVGEDGGEGEEEEGETEVSGGAWGASSVFRPVSSVTIVTPVGRSIINSSSVR